MTEEEKSQHMAEAVRKLRDAVEVLEQLHKSIGEVSAAFAESVRHIEQIKNHITPAKPEETDGLYICPCCGIPFGEIKDINEMINFNLWYTHCCRFCGQALKWE